LETGIGRVVDAIREASHLDALQALYVSNTTADAMAPWLQRWLMLLLEEERGRRLTGAEPTYSVVNFLEWPTAELITTALFTLGVLECTKAMAQPTLVQFGVQLHKVILACICVRLANAEHA
jgi:hypothetical protein